jgi:hypothetical protein
MTQITHKLIVVNDLNRELSPIGYGFQSPIYKPSKFPVDIIGQLLNVSRVTAMFEVYEKDHTLQVLLNNANFRKPFAEIWAEQNPNTPFPWEGGVEDVKAPAAPVEPPADVPPTGGQQEQEQGETGDTGLNVDLVDGEHAPLVVESTTVVTNLNSTHLDAAPGEQEQEQEETAAVAGDTDGDVVPPAAEVAEPAAEQEAKVEDAPAAPKAQQHQGNKHHHQGNKHQQRR